MGVGPAREPAAPRRIGVFGGTFDPVHTAHLRAAEAARAAMRLDTILFVPAARPRLRAASPLASIDHRVAMTRLAIKGLDWARLSLVDAARPGPAFSVDTVRDVHREFPAAELYLIVGADSLRSLPEWKDPDRLVRMATIVCVGRPGSIRPDDLPEGHPGRHARYVEGPMSEVSATEIRRRLRAGEPVTGMVPDAVVSYIEAHGLYISRRCPVAS